MTGPTGGEPDVPAFLHALGQRVRLLRATRELTQDQVAAAAGMSGSFVSLIEHGSHGVDVVRLLRLAAVFGLSLPELGDLPGSGTSDRDRSGPEVG